MKIFPGINNRSRHVEKGFATMVFITLLAIMMILAAANTAALIRLHREVRSLEQQQIKRLNGSQASAAPVPLNATSSNHHE